MKTETIDEKSGSVPRLVRATYFWVKYHGQWEVAMKDMGSYWLPASDKPYRDDFFEEIGDEVIFPANPNIKEP